jgi:hypothetical protein
MQENNPGESEGSLVTSREFLRDGSQGYLAKVSHVPAQLLSELKDGCGCVLVYCINSLMYLFAMLEKKVNTELCNAELLLTMN